MYRICVNDSGALQKTIESIFRADGADDRLIEKEWLHAELFPNSRQDSIPLCSTCSSCVAVLVASAPTGMFASKYLIVRVKLVSRLHALHGGKLVGIGLICYDLVKEKQ